MAKNRNDETPGAAADRRRRERAIDRLTAIRSPVPAEYREWEATYARRKAGGSRGLAEATADLEEMGAREAEPEASFDEFVRDLERRGEL